MVNQNNKPSVIVAGAGIGGLVAALGLMQRGFSVTVLEQAPALGEVGAGFQISPNGTRVLFALGLEKEMRAVAWEPQGKQIRLWNSGKRWKLFDLSSVAVERFGYPYLMFHRADFHEVLVAAVRRLQPNALQLNCRVASFTETTERVIVTLEDGRKIDGDVLVGADGVHSVVRRCLFGDDAPIFTGLVAWRGIIPRRRLPEGMLEPVGTNWIGPGRHIIHYFLRKGEILNFVGIVERTGWEVESWSARGTRDECLSDFQNWHDDIRQLICSIESPFKWALMERDPLARWSSRRVTLLGDAAHPTLPFLAQGAVMSIEDGFVLARALSEDSDDIPAALERYQQARVDRTTRIVRGASGNTSRFHNEALKEEMTAERFIEEQWSSREISNRYDWIFEYKADIVSI